MKYIFILLCFGVIACNTPSNDGKSIHSNATTIYFEKVIGAKKEMKLSEITSEVTYISLETKEESLLEQGKVILSDDYIVGFRMLNNESKILLFDKNGTYIRQIGHNGRGPGEYIQLSDITYNQKHHVFYALTNNKSVLLDFDLEGNIKRNAIELNGEESNLMAFNDNIITHTPSNFAFFKPNSTITHQLTIRNLKGEIIRKDHPLKKSLGNYINPFIETATFSKNLTSAYYHVFRDNRIYKIDENANISKIFLDFGKFAFPKDYEWTYDNIQDAYDMDKIMLENALVAANRLFIKYRKNNKRGLLMYHLKTEKAMEVGQDENIGFLDDIDGLGFFSNFYSQGHLLIRIIPASIFLEIKANQFGYSPRIKQMQNKLNEHSNSVVQIVSLKN
jgi:hypothetical protein